MTGIGKSFAGLPALQDIDLVLNRGEVHALVGENGAGKSTLIKIMTGAYQPDAGLIEMEGERVSFHSPASAQRAGVVAIYQEVSVLRHRTVAENMFLGREPKNFGLIDKKRMNQQARDALENLGLVIDPRTRVGELSTALRQMVAITRGVCLNAKVLVFDEPTSSITEQETAILFRVIRNLQSRGTSLVYISHRMDELYAICQTVTVLRDGKLVTTGNLADIPRIELVRAMLGKERVSANRHAAAKRTTNLSRPVLDLEGVAAGKRVRDASVQVLKGEIIGMAGLLGSGRSETARLIFGAERRDGGSITLKGYAFRPSSPSHAIRAGVGFVSEDRKHDGIVPDLSVRENLTLAALPEMCRYGIISKRRQREIVHRFIERLGIRLRSPEQKIRELSGGNQQKVLLARALCRNPAVLLLDEPTRGIDLGAKDEIQILIRELAASGMGVLMISSELQELVENCSRVVVMRDGCTVAEVAGDELSEEKIMQIMAKESA